jgi:sugar-specific transcriptional regulator TrmB
MTNYINQPNSTNHMKEALEYYGLSDNEIKVYLSVLKLGESCVTEIANKAETYRTLTYEVLKALENKGLVSSAIKEKKKHFIAASPHKLLENLKEKERRVNEILPELTAIHKSVTFNPNMTVYTGLEGIKNIYEDILRTKKPFLVMTTIPRAFAKQKHILNNFIIRRVEQGIPARLIIDRKPVVTELTEYKIIKFNLPTQTFIYGNKVATIHVGKEFLGTIIESEDHAKTQRVIFDWIWNTAKSKP